LSTHTPGLSFEGMAPTDPDDLRVFLTGFAEREGEWAQPRPDGGVVLLLHPAAEPLTIALKDGHLRGQVQTATCGPGFHQSICRLLRRVKDRFSPDLRVHDHSGYFESGDRAALEQAMMRWRVGSGHRAAEALRRRSQPILFGLPPGSIDPAGARRRVVTALKVYRRSEWLEATDAVERGEDLPAHFPWWAEEKDGWYWFNRGLAYLNVRRREGAADDNRFRRAVDAFKRAREKQADLPFPEARIAFAFERLQRYEDAILHMGRAIEAEPQRFDLYPCLARLHARLGQHAEAADRLEALAKRCSGFSEVSYEAGLWLNATEEFERGRRCLDRAIELNPKKAKYHGELAVSLAGLGEIEAALEANDRALEGEPNNAAGWGNRATLLEALDRLEEATAARERMAGLQRPADQGS